MIDRMKIVMEVFDGGRWTLTKDKPQAIYLFYKNMLDNLEYDPVKKLISEFDETHHLIKENINTLEITPYWIESVYDNGFFETLSRLVFDDNEGSRVYHRLIDFYKLGVHKETSKLFIGGYHSNYFVVYGDEIRTLKKKIVEDIKNDPYLFENKKERYFKYCQKLFERPLEHIETMKKEAFNVRFLFALY